MNSPTAEQKILLVEDDKQMRRMLRVPLAAAGYRLLEAEGVQAGLHLFRAHTPDLVILDINLPDGDGFELCKAIRAHKTLFATPIIMMTGRSRLEEKTKGFEAGADQYLVKPISPEELLLWSQALLRRIRYDTGEGGPLRVDDLVIDLEAHVVRYQDQAVINLTLKEIELLYFLAKHRPKALSRKYILSNLWHTITIDHVVDVHISNLRKRLPPKVADKIQTIPGKGYRFFE